MILILYAYGGWNEVGYLGGEVRSAHGTIPRTLGWGLAVVAGLYAPLNLSYAVGLGWDRFTHSASPAAEILAIPFACGRRDGDPSAALRDTVRRVAWLADYRGAA